MSEEVVQKVRIDARNQLKEQASIRVCPVTAVKAACIRSYLRLFKHRRVWNSELHVKMVLPVDDLQKDRTRNDKEVKSEFSCEK